MIQKIINTLGTRLFSAMFNLLIAIIISQYLGTAGKGQQGLILASITYILVFSNLIGGNTLVYLVARYGVRPLLLPSYIWTLLMSLAFYLILSLSKIIEDAYILNIAVLAVISSFISIHTSLLVGLEKIKSANFLGLLQPLIILVMLAYYFIFGIDLSIAAYFKALYFSFIIVLVWSGFLLRNQFNSVGNTYQTGQLQLIGEMFRVGILNQLAHIFQLLSFRMSYYWLGRVYSESEVGIFSNGTSLIESVWLISRSISLVQYSRIVNMTDKQEAQILTLNLSKFSFVISFFLLLVMVFLPPNFYEFIFGEGFGKVQIVIRSLAPGILFLNFNIIISHYFSGTGKYHINSIASFAGLIAAVIFFSFMIPAYGLLGAGLASSISYIITSVTIIFFFRKHSGIKITDFLIKPNDVIQCKQYLYHNIGFIKKIKR